MESDREYITHLCAIHVDYSNNRDGRQQEHPIPEREVEVSRGGAE